ncbi:AAA family ATPase [Streptomyces sp. NBC_00271]|uniref:AAA family ATPase n=1 Tax=Streptomyces sp. NBC_00271 TaxID=2975697 RepID=UPI002E2B3416|nr:AAA family ATPase [Streptomyces sp. NBC_00271]
MPILTLPALTGRESELKILERTVVEGAASGGVLVIVGDPGIGKSALLRAAERKSRVAGFRVLTTVGVEAEAQLPFAGLHQLLDPVLATVDALPASECDALLAAFGRSDSASRPELSLIARAALGLLAAGAAERPVAVIADDVQWLDAQTQETLTFIARRAQDTGLVVIGAARTGHEGPFVSAGFPELHVRGVDDASAERILLSHAGDLGAAARRRIRHEASGNPLALLELPTLWRGPDAPTSDQQPLPLTARLERAFAGRMAELPDATRDAVLVAAVDGTNDVSEILAATGVLSRRDTALDVLEPAERAGLLTVSAASVEFRHPLVRSGVLQSETVRRRQAANAALSAVLVDEPYRRTWHRAQSVVGPDDEIADELEATVTESLSRGAVMSAIAGLERSAQLTSSSARRGHRLLLAAEHAFRMGRESLVDRLVGTAARTELDELDRARAQWLREIFKGGALGEATRVLELCDVARRSVDAGDTDLSLYVLAGAALRCWWTNGGPVVRARVVQAAEGLVGLGHDPRCIVTLAIAEPVLKGGDVSRRLERIDIDDIDDAVTLRRLGMAAYAIGDLPQAADLLDKAESTLRDQGSLGMLTHVLSLQAGAQLGLGDWTRADEAAREGLRLAEETGQTIWHTGTMVYDALANGLRGNAGRALELTAQAEVPARRLHLNAMLCWAQLARGLVWFVTGRYAEAYAAYRRPFDPADPSFHQRERFNGVMLLAEAAVYADRRDDARDVVAGLEETAALTPSPMLLVQLLYARAVLADDAQAEALYLEGLEYDLSRWPWGRARIQLAYGSWLRRAGRLGDARPQLRAAHRTLRHMGALTWSDMALRELIQARGEAL